MFDDIIREVQRLERGFTVSVPIPEDEKGYVDRQCPSNNCRALYKVFGSDWDKKVGKCAFCPLCRHEAQEDQWATKQQREYVKAVALRKMKDLYHNALEAGARSFNQRPQSGFLRFSLSVTRDRTPVFLPRAVGDIMEQSFTCEACSCRYSSIGAAFFCPACGHNSALSTFSQTLETIQNTMDAMEQIRHSFGGDRDAAENAVRMVTEQALAKLVGAFERFAEALFLH